MSSDSCHTYQATHTLLAFSVHRPQPLLWAGPQASHPPACCTCNAFSSPRVPLSLTFSSSYHRVEVPPTCENPSLGGHRPHIPHFSAAHRIKAPLPHLPSCSDKIPSCQTNAQFPVLKLLSDLLGTRDRVSSLLPEPLLSRGLWDLRFLLPSSLPFLGFLTCLLLILCLSAVRGGTINLTNSS